MASEHTSRSRECGSLGCLSEGWTASSRGHPAAWLRGVPHSQFLTGGVVEPDRFRQRSLGFLEQGDESWSCTLVTYQVADSWRGFFSFRPRHAEEGDGEDIRTAEIFIEESESHIDRKARDLGRPLLLGLLASALHLQARSDQPPPRLRGWFQSMLQKNSRELSGGWEEEGSAEGERTVAGLQSLYASYRVDQVAHLITLISAQDFHEMVEKILDGEAFDFSTKDRLQFAMMVVEFIERHLPLPPFEVWAEDYLANRDEYRQYAHTLHRTGHLP